MAMTLGRAGINKWLPAVVGGKVKNQGCDAKQFRLYLDGENRQLHPCQKPIGFVSWLISELSTANNLIADPFLGSGTTAYCAKKLNRKCIGIEIEEKYCEVAAKRCCQTVMNFDTLKGKGE